MRITIIILLLFGLITAIIASSKGRDFLSWWIYGTLLFPFALIHAALLRGTIESIEEIQRRRGLIKCPH
ncbi:MAG: zinc ribbon domain-containing protein, partial [Nitrospiria bacterium]